MDLIDIEDYVDLIYTEITDLLKTTPETSGWTGYFATYNGSSYRYIFNQNTRMNQEPELTYTFSTKYSECIFKILNKTNEIIYITQNSQYRIDLDISEEWHFQQMTVKPLISYDALLKVRKIYEIINKR